MMEKRENCPYCGRSLAQGEYDSQVCTICKHDIMGFKFSDGPVKIPVWSGSFMMADVEIKCHVLSSGERIIEAESMEKLFSGKYGIPTLDQVGAFAKWTKS